MGYPLFFSTTTTKEKPALCQLINKHEIIVILITNNTAKQLKINTKKHPNYLHIYIFIYIFVYANKATQQRQTGLATHMKRTN